MDELVSLLNELQGEPLYVRWSRDIAADLVKETSRDDLTGIELPGLSANPVTVEPWWGSRSPRLWAARKLYDYRHLVDLRGPGTIPWLLKGTESSRGPDNEPLITNCTVVAAIDERVIDEAKRIIGELSVEWGGLRRR